MSAKNQLLCRFLKTWGLAVIALLATPSYGGFNLELQGASSNSSAGLAAHKDSSVSASVGIDLGSHFMIGLTHRVANKYQEELRKLESADGSVRAYLPYSSDTRSVINSLNLSVILYNGVVSPYIFGGFANHTYYTRIDNNGEVSEGKFSLNGLPNYGFGFLIYLNQNFSLKITQTYAPGAQITLDENGQEQSKAVWDPYTEIGIRYKI